MPICFAKISIAALGNALKVSCSFVKFKFAMVSLNSCSNSLLRILLTSFLPCSGVT